MTKKELVAKMSEKADISKKDSEAALKAFTEIVMEEVAAGNKISLIGFGTFEPVERAAREIRNPKTGEKQWSGTKHLAKFSMSSVFKNMLNS